MTTLNQYSALHPDRVVSSVLPTDLVAVERDGHTQVAKLNALLGIDPAYAMMHPFNQPVGSGPSQDMTSNDCDFFFNVGWTDDATGMWRTPGYIQSNASGTRWVPYSRFLNGFHFSTDSFILSVTLNDALPGASSTIFGSGYAGIVDGFYISARTSGSIRPIPIVGGIAISTLADSSAVFFDGTPHVLTICYDGVEHILCVYMDGVLSNIYDFSSLVGTAITGPFALGASAIVSPATNFTYKFKNMHGLTWISSGLPYNLNSYVQKLTLAGNIPIAFVGK